MEPTTAVSPSTSAVTTPTTSVSSSSTSAPTASSTSSTATKRGRSLSTGLPVCFAVCLVVLFCHMFARRSGDDAINEDLMTTTSSTDTGSAVAVDGKHDSSTASTSSSTTADRTSTNSVYAFVSLLLRVICFF